MLLCVIEHKGGEEMEKYHCCFSTPGPQAARGISLPRLEPRLRFGTHPAVASLGCAAWSNTERDRFEGFKGQQILSASCRRVGLPHQWDIRRGALPLTAGTSLLSLHLPKTQDLPRPGGGMQVGGGSANISAVARAPALVELELW